MDANFYAEYEGRLVELKVGLNEKPEELLDDEHRYETLFGIASVVDDALYLRPGCKKSEIGDYLNVQQRKAAAEAEKLLPEIPDNRMATANELQEMMKPMYAGLERIAQITPKEVLADIGREFKIPVSNIVYIAEVRES